MSRIYPGEGLGDSPFQDKIITFAKTLSIKGTSLAGEDKSSPEGASKTDQFMPSLVGHIR